MRLPFVRAHEFSSGRRGWRADISHEIRERHVRLMADGLPLIYDSLMEKSQDEPFTMLIVALLTGEAVTPLMLVGGAIILVGVYLGALAPRSA